MEFISFDENQNISNFGACKATINAHSKQVIVEPIDEGELINLIN